MFPHCYTSGSPYNEGDGIAMAMSVGADLCHMNNYAGPFDGPEGAGGADVVFVIGDILDERGRETARDIGGDSATVFRHLDVTSEED